MIVRHVSPAGEQLVQPADEVGFGLEEVRFLAGDEVELAADRSESLFVTEGRGEVRDQHTGQRAQLEQGVVCVLRPGDRVLLTAATELAAVRAMMPPADA